MMEVEKRADGCEKMDGGVMKKRKMVDEFGMKRRMSLMTS